MDLYLESFLGVGMEYMFTYGFHMSDLFERVAHLSS